MKNLIRLEELAQFLFVLCILIFVAEAEWWWFLILLIGPDISMLGYLIGPKTGAILYNLFHHKGTALIIFGCAYLFTDPIFQGEDFLLNLSLALYGHASFDRIAGYGLKYFDSFQHTHLGMIGTSKK